MAVPYSTTALPPHKRVLSEHSGSDSSEGSLSHSTKKGKSQDLSPNLFDSLSDAASVPLPVDDDTDNDLNLTSPPDPENFADISPSMTQASLDSFLTTIAPNKPAVRTVSQSSSSGQEMFISRKTRPQPVYGTGNSSKSKRGDSSL